MWKTAEDRYRYWMAISRDFNQFISELSQAETEEDGDLFLLMLHLEQKNDLWVFDAEERKKINRLLKQLVHETKRHRRTLGRLVKVLCVYKERMLKA